jgi:hypothetical protein
MPHLAEPVGGGGEQVQQERFAGRALRQTSTQATDRVAAPGVIDSIWAWFISMRRGMISDSIVLWSIAATDGEP